MTNPMSQFGPIFSFRHSSQFSPPFNGLWQASFLQWPVLGSSSPCLELHVMGISQSSPTKLSSQMQPRPSMPSRQKCWPSSSQAHSFWQFRPKKPGLQFVSGALSVLASRPLSVTVSPRHPPFLRLRLKGMRSLKNPRKVPVFHALGKISALPLNGAPPSLGKERFSKQTNKLGGEVRLAGAAAQPPC